MDYYQKILIERNIILDSKYINKNLNENILTLLKNEIEDKCIGEGYIQKDSIEIIQRSIGTILTNSFKANVSYHVLANVNVCNPPKDSIIQTKVVGINKSGIFCVNEPLNILVIKNLMKNDEFDNINIGDTIKVRVKDKKFNLYDNVIKVIAEIVNDDETESKRKINKSNVLHNKSIKITISDNIDDSDDDSIFSDAEEAEIQSITTEDDVIIGEETDIHEEDTLKEEKHTQIVDSNLIEDDEDDEDDEDEEDEDDGEEIIKDDDDEEDDEVIEDDDKDIIENEEDELNIEDDE